MPHSALHTAPTGAPEATGAQTPDRLPPGYSVVAGREVRTTRHWLDTFDRRLLGRGVTVHLDDGAGVGAGARSRADEARLTVEAPGGPAVSVPWPLHGGEPPDVLSVTELSAEVQSRLSGPAGGRALLPLVSARVGVREDRVIDDEGKTVSRLIVQSARAVAAPGDDDRGPEAAGAERAVLVALRGYESVTRRVAAGLELEVEEVEAGGGGDAAAPVALLRDLLARTGGLEAPGSGAAGRGLEPNLPAPEGVASILSNLLEVVSVNLPGTLARYDDEFLHDLRVAVRRGRTALKIAQGVVAEPPRAELATELKWLGDLTTPARDLDVHLQELPDLTAVVAPDLQEFLGPFADLLRNEWEEAHDHLGRGLRSERFERLLSWSPSLLAEPAAPGSPPPARGAPPAAMTTSQFARLRLSETFNRVIKRGRRVGPDTEDEAVHDLRKRAKELRYTIEFFSSLMPAGVTELVRDLKGTQDVLGGFNDTVVQRAFLRDCAERLAGAGAPALTLMALGEVSRDLAGAGQRARAELPARFERLRRWHRDGRLAELLDALE